MSPTPSALPLLPLLLLFCGLLITLTSHLHYSLPVPLPPTPDTFSEVVAKTHIDHLAATIGYRILGTRELVEAEEWLWDVLEGYRKESESGGNGVQMEMWKQTGGGSHLFDFMGKKVWKRYHVTNTIVRLSNGTPSGKEHAVLINAHLDSTLPSPGAADDLIGVAVMLDAIRILTTSNNWPELRHSVIFLFNGAEESLQDASHLFITQHELRHSVRSVINLEACGVAGREIVFQATSDEMINAYSKIPHPYGTIIGTEIFSSGIILSDTDFRQFEQYGNLTGLDMALVQDSYKYHTRLDTPDRIEPGALQHMGENTLALIRHLATSPSSKLSTIPPRGQPGARPGDTVFCAMFGGKVFIKYSKTTAIALYTALAAIAVPLAVGRVRKGRMAAFLLACVGTQVSVVAAVAGSNIVAVVMTLLGRPLSWYRHEHLPILLFGPPALVGVLGTQYLIRKAVVAFGMAPGGRRHEAERFLEHHTFKAQLATSAVLALVGQMAGLGSSYVLSIQTVVSIVVAVVNDFVLVRDEKLRTVPTATYFVAALLPTVLGWEGMLSFLDLFVPLTGRMGAEAPVDNIIASVVGGVGAMQLSFLLPLSHRFGDRFLLRSIIFSLLLSTFAIAVFSQPATRWALFDHEHPRRVFALHMENVSVPITDQGAFALHIASVDKAPGFEDLVRNAMQGMGVRLSKEVGGEGSDLIPNQMNDEIPDWDIVYPVSQFLVSYKVPLPPVEASYASPWRQSFTITAAVDKLNAVESTRTISLVINHPGIIWSVIAFNADVIEWDLAEAPERGMIRHHVKEVSTFGHDQWRLNMKIQLGSAAFEAAQRLSQRSKKQRAEATSEDDLLGRLRIDFSGLDESGMWPASKNRGEDRPGMKFLKEMDSHMPDHADLMLLSAVANVAYV